MESDAYLANPNKTIIPSDVFKSSDDTSGSNNIIDIINECFEFSISENSLPHIFDFYFFYLLPTRNNLF